jgi:ankyrin repeat protein
MSSAPLDTPPLRQTTRLLRAHLLCALADIAEEYILPENMTSAWSIVEAGHYELCMTIKGIDYGLASACDNGYIDIAQLMIAKGASNWNGGLYHACSNGHIDIARLMIAKGASNYNSGLSCACINGHMNIIQLMIDKGASDWNGGLSCACINGHMNIIQLMIDKGGTACFACDNSKHSFTG